MSGMTIANLAREGGVGVETVRYYQRRGLMAVPPREEKPGYSGMRRYGEADLRRLRFIRSAQGAGFTLEEVRELVELDASNDRRRARALAEERMAALDAKIAELTSARVSLAALASACAAGDEGPCPIISAFEEQGCRHQRT